MSIPVTCECGATFNAKDSFAGRAVTCRSCGGTFTVPDEPAAPDLSVEPLKEAPRVVGKKRKKKSASGKRDSSEQTLEQRIAARSAAAPRAHWLVTVLTGDIRPLLVGGTCVLLGIGSVVLAFIGPEKIGEEAAREHGLDETMTRNTRTGMGILGGIYKMFGETGMMVFLILFGLALMAGGAWFFWTHRHGMEED
jgi:hypothetical protein